MRRVRAMRAFTLIEVLVALAIVTVGMAAVMGALSSSANNTSYLRDRTFAQWVALNQIANLRLAGQQPPTGDSNGDTDFAGRSWHWKQEVVSTEVPGVERIDVSVRPAEVKADEDSGWYTTVSGIWGDAVAPPNANDPSWIQQANGMGQSANPLVPQGIGGIGQTNPTPAPTPTPTPGPGRNR